MHKYKIDFYKEFKLVPPVCGLVQKITSPKGIRRKESDAYTSYHLHTELMDIYEPNRPSEIESGLYWVLDVCKIYDKMTWFNYLFIVLDGGRALPVGEFLRCKDSTWIKDALPIIKSYFEEEELSPIKLTYIPRPTPKLNRWSQVRR